MGGGGGGGMTLLGALADENTCNTGKILASEAGDSSRGIVHESLNPKSSTQRPRNR